MDWGTVIAAALGSTVVAGIFNALIVRFRYSRRAEVLSSWKAESDLADMLEEAAGIVDDQKSARGKAAFALAARSELHKKLANELVPQDGFSMALFATLSFISCFFGIIVVGVGVTEVPSVFGVLMILAGIVIFVLFAIAAMAMIHASMVRDSLRGAIIRVLNVNLPYATKYVQYVDESGKQTLRVCSAGKWQRIVRNAMGVDIATTVEEFLRRTLDEQSGIDSNFIGPRLF